MGRGGLKKIRNFITVSTKLFYDAQMKGAPSDGTRHEQKNYNKNFNRKPRQTLASMGYDYVRVFKTGSNGINGVLLAQDRF